MIKYLILYIEDKILGACRQVHEMGLTLLLLFVFDAMITVIIMPCLMKRRTKNDFELS